MIDRDKLKNPLRLEGRAVILDEIQPKYFPYVIEWRNNPKLNRFLNQPFELTMELETNWYEKKFLHDNTQGFMVMIDKETMIPFGTIGWTDFDSAKRRLISGRLILGNSHYAHQPAFLESSIVLDDYLYNFVDIQYCHVVKENRKALHFDTFRGFAENKGEIQYPHELFVNGMEQIEFYRTKEMYLEMRKNIYEFLGDALFT